MYIRNPKVEACKRSDFNTKITQFPHLNLPLPPVLTCTQKYMDTASDLHNKNCAAVSLIFCNNGVATDRLHSNVTSADIDSPKNTLECLRLAQKSQTAATSCVPSPTIHDNSVNPPHWMAWNLGSHRTCAMVTLQWHELPKPALSEHKETLQPG